MLYIIVQYIHKAITIKPAEQNDDQISRIMLIPQCRTSSIIRIAKSVS